VYDPPVTFKILSGRWVGNTGCPAKSSTKGLGVPQSRRRKVVTLVQGKAVNDSPVRKWPHVRRFPQVCLTDNRKDVNWDSTCARSGHFFETRVLPMALLICYPTDFMPGSQRPSKWRAWGGMKCQLIPSLVVLSLTLWWWAGERSN
jgi:hypothetical protein